MRLTHGRSTRGRTPSKQRHGTGRSWRSRQDEAGLPAFPPAKQQRPCRGCSRALRGGVGLEISVRPVWMVATGIAPSGFQQRTRRLVREQNRKKCAFSHSWEPRRQRKPCSPRAVVGGQSTRAAHLRLRRAGARWIGSMIRLSSWMLRQPQRVQKRAGWSPVPLQSGPS